MLSSETRPTPLAPPSNSGPLPLVPDRRPSPFRVFLVLYRILSWGFNILFLWLTRNWTPQLNAQLLKLLFENLGGFWIKLGQILSLRYDVFSAEFCAELSGLQDRAPGFPAETALSILHNEMLIPVEDVFEYFEEQPVAAASIAQVHKARLRKGRVWVAVKVQRPNAKRELRQDMAFIRYVVRILDWLPGLSALHGKDMLWELENAFEEETDYRLEAASILQMRTSLKDHNIYVPEVFQDLSSENILVMEYVHGVFLTEYIQMKKIDPAGTQTWLTQNNISPEQVARHLYLSLVRQLFEDNLFHGDLHPGNIVLLRNSAIALIDFGTVGSLDKTDLENYQRFIQAIVEQKYAKATDFLLLLSSSLPEQDLPRVKLELVRALRKWSDRARASTLAFTQRSIASNFVALSPVMIRHGISMDWSFLKIHRTHLALDACIASLNPDIDYQNLVAEHFQRAHQRSILRQGRPEELAAATADWLSVFSTLPGLLQERLQLESRTSRANTLQAKATTGAVHTPGPLRRLLARIVQAGQFLVLAGLLQQHPPEILAPITQQYLSWLETRLPELSAVTWIIVLGVLLYLYRILSKPNTRFPAQKPPLPRI